MHDLSTVTTKELCDEFKTRFDASIIMGVQLDMPIKGQCREHRTWLGNTYILEGMLASLTRRIIANDEELPDNTDDGPRNAGEGD